MIVPLEAPRSPAASQVSIASRATHRVRNRGESLVWQSVFCPICDCEYGQFTYDPSPGDRDPATWTYRVADEQGALFVLQDLLQSIQQLFFICARCVACFREIFERGHMLGKFLKRESKNGFLQTNKDAAVDEKNAFLLLPAKRFHITCACCVCLFFVFS